MGVLSVLGKIGKGIGKGVASFIPGGRLITDAIDAGSEMLAGGGAAAKEGRLDEATLQAQMNSRNNADQLNAAQFNAGREGSLIRRALSARMLGDRPGPTDPRDRFGGGATSPAMLEMLSRYGGMADRDVMSGGYKVHPAMSAIPKSGVMEKIGGVAGTAGGILGILGKLKPSSPDAPRDMGQLSQAPNLPYQPLPREQPWLPSRPIRLG